MIRESSVLLYAAGTASIASIKSNEKMQYRGVMAQSLLRDIVEYDPVWKKVDGLCLLPLFVFRHALPEHFVTQLIGFIAEIGQCTELFLEYLIGM